MSASVEEAGEDDWKVRDRNQRDVNLRGENLSEPVGFIEVAQPA